MGASQDLKYVRGYSEATQDMLNVSGRGVLNKSNV